MQRLGRRPLAGDFTSRWSSSFNGGGGGGKFRAGAVISEAFNFKNTTVPAWQPGPQYMKYRPVKWLVENAIGLATYQLALEAGCTAIFGLLLWFNKLTVEDVVSTLEAYHYPFTSWMTFDDCKWTEPVHVGSFTLNPEKLTAAHTGHNIANGLLPIQVLILAATYPMAMKYFRWFIAKKAAAAGGSTKATSAAAEAAKLHEARKAAQAQVNTSKVAAAGSEKRRASYARHATRF